MLEQSDLTRSDTPERCRPNEALQCVDDAPATTSASAAVPMRHHQIPVVCHRRKLAGLTSAVGCLVVAALIYPKEESPLSSTSIIPSSSPTGIIRLPFWRSEQFRSENQSTIILHAEKSHNTLSRDLKDGEEDENGEAGDEEGGADNEEDEESESEEENENNSEGEQDEEEEQDSKEEEDAEQDDDNNNDDELEDDDDAVVDDDYFDDAIQDDLYNYVEKYVDDFYAYAEDPGPPTLMPLTARTVIGFLIAAMALSLGASGGVGGGGIVNATLVLVAGLPLRVAIPIGALTVLGRAFASTLLNVHRRHPLADRPIIDWDLVLVMEPLTLIGTLLGIILHRILSEKILVVLLVLLLSATAHTTLSKTMRMYHAETRYIRHLKAAQAHPPSGSPRSGFTWGAKNDNKNNGASNTTLDTEEKQQILIMNPDFVTLRSELMEHEKFAPRSKIIAIVFMFSVLVFLNVMVGGGAYKSPWDIRCGSTAFWVMHVIMVAFLFASAWAAQTYVVARHEIKQIVRFDYVHGDIKWDARSSIIYPAVFVSAGLFAGTLGIGGGVITVPIMLATGVHPAVVSATSSAMILFTSFASVSSFAVFGLILPDFAMVGFFLGFFASLIGQSIMRQARQARSASGRNFERNSYIAFAIGGVVLISALLMTVQYVFLIVDEPDEDDGGLCDGLRL